MYGYTGTGTMYINLMCIPRATDIMLYSVCVCVCVCVCVLQLVSPDDLVNACNMFEPLRLPLRYMYMHNINFTCTCNMYETVHVVLYMHACMFIGKCMMYNHVVMRDEREKEERRKQARSNK